MKTCLFKIVIPVHTVSEANCSEHWRQKKKRHDVQKRYVKIYCKWIGPKCPLPCEIKLTRMGKKKLDSDNLPVSMKYIRDSIADLIFPGLSPGQADNDERLSWEYAQEIGKNYGVIVEIFNDSCRADC